MKKEPIRTGRRIPIRSLKEIAKTYGYSQVVLHAYDGKTGIQSVVTFGETIADCEHAAKGGNAIKKILGWPEDKCNATPKRTK